MKTKKDWRAIASVTVVYAGGRTLTYSSLDEAVEAVGWGSIKQCTRGFLRCYVPFDYQASLYLGDPVVFLDELGLIIPVWRVREAAVHLNLHQPRFYPRWIRYEFRSGPVSGLRRSPRWWRWRDYRGYNTQAERRENAFLDRFDEEAREHQIKSRPARNVIPDPWDDVPRTRTIRRNWKRYRRHQWRR